MPQRGDKPAREHLAQFEGPIELFEPVGKAKDLLKFWKTLNAVSRQEPLYDYDKRRLEDAGYQGPWHFNLTQSVISGLPGLMIPSSFIGRSFPLLNKRQLTPLQKRSSHSPYLSA